MTTAPLRIPTSNTVPVSGTPVNYYIHAVSVSVSSIRMFSLHIDTRCCLEFSDFLF